MFNISQQFLKDNPKVCTYVYFFPVFVEFLANFGFIFLVVVVVIFLVFAMFCFFPKQQGPCTGNQQSLAHSRLWDAVVGFLHVFAHMQMKLSQVSFCFPFSFISHQHFCKRETNFNMFESLITTIGRKNKRDDRIQQN